MGRLTIDRTRRMGAAPRSLAAAIRLAAVIAVLVVAAPAPSAPQEPETGTFTLAQSGAAIATESFRRTADSLTTELTITGQATLVARATLRPDATLARIAIRVYGPGGATGEPLQTSAVTFERGTATFEQPIGTAAGKPREVDPGAVPYLNPSPSLLEQILRRARVLGGDSVVVSIWTPGPGGGQVLNAPVVFGDGTATLTLGDMTMEVATDAVGRLLSARVPSQALVIERK